jgi:hypothetical protein
MLWIGKVQVFTRDDSGSAEQRRRELHFHGFVVMCIEKIRRLRRRFFIIIFAW